MTILTAAEIAYVNKYAQLIERRDMNVRNAIKYGESMDSFSPYTVQYLRNAQSVINAVYGWYDNFVQSYTKKQSYGLNAQMVHTHTYANDVIAFSDYVWGVNTDLFYGRFVMNEYTFIHLQVATIAIGLRTRDMIERAPRYINHDTRYASIYYAVAHLHTNQLLDMLIDMGAHPSLTK